MPSVDGLHALMSGVHGRLRGNFEHLVDVTDLPGFAEPRRAHEAALETEVAVPTHLDRCLDRYTRICVAQHAPLVARILLVEDQRARRRQRDVGHAHRGAGIIHRQEADAVGHIA